MNFVVVPYFTLTADLCREGKMQDSFPASLHSWKSKKIATGKDFTGKGILTNKNRLHLKGPSARELVKALSKKTTQWTVKEVEKQPVSRSPKPPFITSTLQQAGSRMLNLSPRQTMSLAQKLYEKGLITYMRTDSTSLSQQALRETRRIISSLYGQKELTPKARFYKTKVKGAQEAHEAIRPAGSAFKPPAKAGLSGGELKLYELIWKRTLACQMKNCEQEQTHVQIQAGREAVFSTSGLRIVSPGFYRALKEREETGPLLPPLKKGDKLKCLKLVEEEHKTQPPFRYNEASLIQKLEKEGIGRPSTYAPIISTIQDRGYVRKKNKSLAPTFTALAVTKLLNDYLPDYVDLGFTSKMEKTLDDMALGKTGYVGYLNKIYKGKQGLKQQVEQKEKQIDGTKSRTLTFSPFKGINFHVGRFGAYITRKQGKTELKSSLPEELFLSDITVKKLEELLKAKKSAERAFGADPKTKKKIFIKTGRFGPYLELEGGEKRASIPRFLSPENLKLEQALQLLELPKTLGLHPKTKKEIKKSIGRYGPYIAHDGDFRSVPAKESFLSLDLKEALRILAQEKRGRKKSSKKVLKKFSYKKEEITVQEGYSPYLRFKNKNYSLPKGTDPLKLTLETALSIIQSRPAGGKKKKPSSRPKTSFAKKTSGKKKAPSKTKRGSRSKTSIKKTGKKKKRSSA